MKNTLIFFTSVLLMFSCQVGAQNSDPFVGTFVDQQQSTALVLQTSGNGYEGAISSGNIYFTLTAQRVGQQLQGQIISGIGTSLPWSATINGNQLQMSASGVTTVFYRMNTQGQPQGGNGSNTDYQNYQRGASNPYNNGNTGVGNQLSSREAQKIAGSRLYWFRKASILATGGGAYGEIDFCPNGFFKDYTESSITVEGGSRDYNTGRNTAWASSASWERSSGKWSITNVQGQRALVLQYKNGNTVTYYLNNVMSGSWYIGKVKYAMDWGKGQCQ